MFRPYTHLPHPPSFFVCVFGLQIANEYDILNRIARHHVQDEHQLGVIMKPRRVPHEDAGLDDHLAGILLNSQRCSALRTQAGYNYTLAGQGHWRLPLKVVGDKKVFY